MARSIATKTTVDDLDPVDRELLEELRQLRRDIEKGEKAKAEKGPKVIAKLRGRGVEGGIIADAFGVSRGRVYQIEPVAPATKS